MIKVIVKIRDYSVMYYSSAGDVWCELSRHFTYAGATRGLMGTFGAYPHNPFWKIKKWSDGWEVGVERLDARDFDRKGLRDGFLPMKVVREWKKR